MKELRAIVAAARAAAARGEPLALATLVQVRGSSYRQPGARLLVGPEGPRVGAISGGCLEADVVLRAREAMQEGAPRLVTYDLRGERDLVWGHGLGCEGVADVLVEPLPVGSVPAWLEALDRRLTDRRTAVLSTVIEGPHLGDRRVLAGAETGRPGSILETIVPPLALWIFGAGEDARPLAALASGVGLAVGVVDPRPALATRARFPTAERIEVRHPGDGVEALGLDDRSAAVLLTHNYQRDLAWLEALLPGPAAYLGLLGSRPRAARLLADLARRGRAPSERERARLYAPVGLDIGAESPEEIALAIVAEVQAVMAGRAGGCLRETRGALHAAAEGGLEWRHAAIS